ncbi:hypothetical protein ASD21_12310 [Caulobacter sp. Root1455]|uniref:hypothetical protein n=1 Tax=Caulobacter sp. Root1455 TaxID=1736465 RepID=UPI0007009ABB|nr:hypothetical protein [Caulobacter sp. Root1455]KQY92207.1 hypothetical protein ASD21_12310 [Caulobacter sp. Root1455]
MNIFDFLTQDEIDGAPEDPAFAFTYLTSIAQRRLSDELKSYSDDESGYRHREDAHFDFQNVIIALAKSFKIEPFASMVVPQHAQFDYQQQRSFKTELDHFMTQLVVGNSIRGKKDSVGFPPKVKDRLRSHINALKKCIDDANLTDARKAGLHKKLLEFETSLDGNRVNLFAVTRIVFEIMSVTANGVALFESPTVNKLVTNILSTVAEAKAAEDEQRQLPPHAPPVMLSAPRPTPRREEFSADLDDEIPF